MQQSLAAAELIDERPDERLDTARLLPYLRTHLPGADGELSVRQFFGGKANLTYLLSFTPTPTLPRLRGRERLGGARGSPPPQAGEG